MRLNDKYFYLFNHLYNYYFLWIVVDTVSLLSLQQETTSDGNSEHNSSGDEESQQRMRLKRKLQRNRTSFTNEQIDALEKGKISFLNYFKYINIFLHFTFNSNKH